MLFLVISLSAILIMSPALAAGKGKRQGKAGDKTHWKSGESPTPVGWGKTQGTRTRTGWGEGTTPKGITERETNPPGFSKGGQVK